MTAVVPSFIAKVTRAEKHIADLESEIAAYAARKPYTVRARVEGKKKVHRLEFTSDPANTDIALVAADAIHNLRFALDHLMAALVPNKQRRSVMFPVYFQGVWEPAQPGDDPERIKSRDRWASDTANVKPTAVAILKELQPADAASDKGEVNIIQTIHRLSTRDRHEKLPVVAVGLTTLALGWERPDKRIEVGGGRARPDYFLQNHAKLDGIPGYAVNMKIEGTPAVGITLPGKNRHIQLPVVLHEAVKLLSQHVIPSLTPFVR